MKTTEEAHHARYEGLPRDARTESLMQSSRGGAAFDAINGCCQPAGTRDEPLDSLRLAVMDAVGVIRLAACLAVFRAT